VAPIPVVAIGGIDAGNAALAVRAGARGVAVISAVAAAPDPVAAARALARAAAGAAA
jgi:thiamine-phosphate pyrophosphorylase